MMRIVIEAQRAISSFFGEGGRLPAKKGKVPLPKACRDGTALLGLADNICPTVVFAESYRDCRCGVLSASAFSIADNFVYQLIFLFRGKKDGCLL